FSLDEEGLQAGMQMQIGDIESLSHVLLLGCDITEEFPVLWLRLKQAINKGCRVRFFGHFAPEIARYLEKLVLHAPGLELTTLAEQHEDILSFFKGAKAGALFVGSQYLANPDRKAILCALTTLPNLSLNILEGRGNSLGARFAGMHPELKPAG